jgi:hypothetical protein
MNNRNFVLFAAFALASNAPAVAMPSIPSPDTPPITVQMGATYNTNIAGSSALLAAVRDLKRVDEIYSPNVNLNLVEPLGAVSLFLTGQAGYNVYQRNSFLDSESLGLQGGANARVSVCDATSWGAWSRNQSNPAELVTANTKNIQQLLSGELDATCTELGNLVPTASISEVYSTNSSAFYNVQDYHSFVANASLAYKAGTIGTFSLTGQYTEATYPNRSLLPGVSDGYDLYSAGIRYETKLSARLNLSASVSETSLSPNANDGRGFSGITYDLALGYHPTERFSISLSLNREVDPASYLNSTFDLNGSVGADESSSSQAATTPSVTTGIYNGQALNATYGINETYMGQVSYRITSRLSASLGASDVHNKFIGAALVPGINIADQTVKSFFGGLAFKASPTLSLSLNAGQDQRHADVLGYSYSGGYVGLVLSKAF